MPSAEVIDLINRERREIEEAQPPAQTPAKTILLYGFPDGKTMMVARGVVDADGKPRQVEAFRRATADERAHFASSPGGQFLRGGLSGEEEAVEKKKSRLPWIAAGVGLLAGAVGLGVAFWPGRAEEPEPEPDDEDDDEDDDE